jgi:hypothetical protein
MLGIAHSRRTSYRVNLPGVGHPCEQPVMVTIFVPWAVHKAEKMCSFHLRGIPLGC